MNNEKMKVLEMLESGKINADEAAKLLEALKGGGQSFVNKETRDNVEEKLRNFAHDCGKLAKEVGGKVQVFYKGVEPKIKKASQTALEKAACVLEDLACAINDSLNKECCGDEDCCCEEASQAECCGEEAPREN
ncbi:MAG: hypothetical protein FWE11_05705 [Defluviitaleaceae bacterium]|nr:hypothetical protein [Defluviitaleaceae bacterium]